MMTVHEVSKLTGVSIRRLHYYDQIGLLRPSDITESGYRLYNDVAIERLQQILLFRELEFPLKEIKQIIDSKTFEKEKALEQQIELLILKKERLESLITFAREIKLSGGKEMDFSAFDTKKIDDAIRRYDNATLLQWRRENRVDSGNLLLFCSVIREKSQLDIAIKALASPELTGLDCRLAVVGDGPAKDHCVELAKELNVSERVLWLGAIRDQDALAPWFLSAKLFVYPGSIGLSILHSLAYGLPVVVNDCASHNGPEYEVLEEGVNGYSFQEGNVESLASVVARALESQEQLKSLGKNGFDTVRRKYSMDAMVSNFCEAIEAAHTWK